MKTVINTLATLALTFAVSGTLIASAVGPATAQGNGAVASTTRLVA
ncbi:hypothetical protein [Sphingomonas rubra]|uniref:Uncharacterized protein n=1 Tax=Sphingomonas rubra TaxID=634430 RepID=A0A1I5SXH6_9SPHN|nr:hypothetical protein [Sphingomonas rubra]SFP75439.1 hypothetical protein SAMN04488241_106223 [Sphingomonas rubra]